MNKLQEQLEQLLLDTKSRLDSASSDATRQILHQEVLGRKGRLAELFSQFGNVPEVERSETGKFANDVKKQIENLFGVNSDPKILTAEQMSQSRSWTAHTGDIQGHTHPLSIFVERVMQTFLSMGYDVLDSPELEDEKHNFDLLNIPLNHPARDEWDTFFVKSGKKQDNILRTHTSPMQIRSMKKRKPPVRIIVPGRVYRHEAVDASHSAEFYQCEGFLIDKNITLTNLMGTLDAFIKTIFGKDTETRFRPHYYPFVEPGMDVDMKFKGEWLEVLGSGMIHPTVLENMGVDPEKFSGFAFGLGIDRLAMLYWGIDDIRHFYSGDMKFGKQFI